MGGAGEGSKDRTLGQMGGVRGLRKVRQLDRPPWGSARRTGAYTGRGGPFGIPAGHHVSHIQLCVIQLSPDPTQQRGPIPFCFFLRPGFPAPWGTPSACEEPSGEREDRGHAGHYREGDQGCRGPQGDSPSPARATTCNAGTPWISTGPCA